MLGERHVFALMGFLGLACSYLMRVNLPASLVQIGHVSMTQSWNTSANSNVTSELILMCSTDDEDVGDDFLVIQFSLSL